MFDSNSTQPAGEPRRNLAASAAAWSAAHWKTAVFGWIVLVTALVVVGNTMGSVKVTRSEGASGDTARAIQMIEEGKFKDPVSEHVIISTRDGSPIDRSADGREAVRELVSSLRATDNVRGLPAGSRGMLSQDGEARLVPFSLAGTPDDAAERVAPAMKTVARVQREHPDLQIGELGDGSGERSVGELMGNDLHRAELTSLPVTFLILLVAFGAFTAAGVPVLLAFSSVLGALGASSIASHAFPISDTTANVILLMGMAVGVDYSLFYLKREREERAAGHAPDEALARAAHSSGRAVLISGLTVLVSTGGLLLSGDPQFQSMGLGAMLVVAMTMVGSLSVLPALLARLGDRVERGVLALVAAAALQLLRPVRRRPAWLVRLRDRRTVLQRLLPASTHAGSRDGRQSRLLGLMLRPVFARPRAAAIACGLLLLVMAAPALSMRTGLPGANGLPKDLPIAQTYQRIDRHFPGAGAPAQVVLRADDVHSPAVTRGIERLREAAHASPNLGDLGPVEYSDTGRVARIELLIAGSGDDDRSRASVRELREEVLPATVGAVPGVDAVATGDAASIVDFNELMQSRLPLVMAFVLGFAFLLMLSAFRSLVVPIVAIVLNLLSVGAAYGVLVWIFQWGHMKDLLGFTHTGEVATWVPLFLFAILFGLSMDYHVFILSRIRELTVRGASTRDAVEQGVRQTASTVTSAAVVMIAVFAIFAMLSMLEIKQMGVGLAVAVLIDATLVRVVLLPAVMIVLGRWNWYLPSWLGWLPKVELERSGERHLIPVVTGIGDDVPERELERMGARA